MATFILVLLWLDDRKRNGKQEYWQTSNNA
jgi:hypothetical protein